MDLHVALAVAIAGEAFGDVRRPRRAGQQPFVELVGRHRADHAARRGDFGSVGELHAARRALIVEQDRGDIRRGADFAAIVLDQRLEGLQQFAGAALDDRRAGGLERERDDLRHLAGIGAFGAEAGMQHPRRPQRAEQRRAIALFEPGAGGEQRFAEECCEAARPAPPGLARDDAQHVP